MKKLLIILLLLLVFPNTCFAAQEDYFDVKVGKSLAEGENFTIQSKDNLYISTTDNQKLFDTELKQLTVIFQNGNIHLSNHLFQVEKFPTDGALLIGSKSPIQISTNGRSYHGFISFRVNSGKLDVINHVFIEDYLKGVLPKEMSESFPLEALKAQAICSRSFAYANHNKYKKLGYQLNDTTACQVYHGQGVETKKTNQAVEETRNLIVQYNGKVANTIFGSNSGGITAADNEVWGGASTPYLNVHKDIYSNLNWEVNILDTNVQNLGVGSLLGLNVIERDSSGRVNKIEIIGTEKTLDMTGNQFRDKLGNMKLKSTLFDIEQRGNEFYIKGRGFGHGVGMSQDGAVNMAKEGFLCSEILSYYFPGTEIVKNEKGNL